MGDSGDVPISNVRITNLSSFLIDEQLVHVGDLRNVPFFNWSLFVYWYLGFIINILKIKRYNEKRKDNNNERSIVSQ